MSVAGAAGRWKLARLLLGFFGAGSWSAVAAPTLHWFAEAKAPFLAAEGFSPAQLQELKDRTRTPAEWAELLAVFVEPAEGLASAGLPPIAGQWQMAGDRLDFWPRFPLERGLRYRAVLKLAGAEPIIALLELPRLSDLPVATVAQVYPSGDIVPENQLKFYVLFSEAMSRGGLYENVRLLDAQGRVIELAFLELEAELWDLGMTRVTLLIDPGRIKRGVKPLEDIGPVFQEGESYSLRVDAAFRDAKGRKLRESFVKKFRAGPADRTPPDPAKWKIRPVAAGTTAPLIIDFGEPMDHELARRLITVRADRNGRVEFLGGETTLQGHEHRWNYAPSQPWTPGRYRIVIDTTIEDLAGNNIGKAFEVDSVGTVERRLQTGSVNLGFEVK